MLAALLLNLSASATYPDLPQHVAGVPQLCAALEAVGVIATGQAATRAAEIMAY